MKEVKIQKRLISLQQRERKKQKEDIPWIFICVLAFISSLGIFFVLQKGKKREDIPVLDPPKNLTQHSKEKENSLPAKNPLLETKENPKKEEQKPPKEIEKLPEEEKFVFEELPWESAKNAEIDQKSKPEIKEENVPIKKPEQENLEPKPEVKQEHKLVKKPAPEEKKENAPIKKPEPEIAQKPDPKAKQKEEISKRELYEIQILAPKLHDPNLHVRLNTMRKIGTMKSNYAFDILKKELPSLKNQKIKEEYIKILSQWKGEKREEARKIVSNFIFSEPSQHAQHLAITSFASMLKEDEIHQPKEFQEGAKLLIKLLAANDPETKKAAIRGLSFLGKQEYIFPIAKAGLSSSKQSVRKEAVLAFSQLKAREQVSILIDHYARETYLFVLEPLVKTVFELDKEKAFPLLLLVLSKKGDLVQVRHIAARFLGQYSSDPQKHPKAIQYLCHYFFNEKDEDLCIIILNSLSCYDYNNPAIKKVFAAAMDDNSRRLRETVKEILRRREMENLK